VIVIDVLGLPGAAQAADAALLEDHPGDLSSIDPVSPVQVERPRAPVMLPPIGPDDLVVTRLAIAPVA